MVWKVATLPVKLTAAKSGELIIFSLKSNGLDGKKLMTPENIMHINGCINKY